MVGPLATRALWGLATLVGAVTGMFGLMVLAPGDPIDLLPNAEAVRPVLAAEWALDQPAPVRLGRWWGRLLSGELGVSLSYRPGMPVAELVWAAAPPTALRVLGALATVLALGTALAWHTSRGERGPSRAVAQATSLVPLFLAVHAVVASLNGGAFALMEAGWIDRPGWFALPDQASLLRTTTSVLLLAVASGSLAEVHADLEVALAELRRSPFVVAARARGESTTALLLRHLLPRLCTVAAGRLAMLLGGAIVVEKLMLLPGAGAMLWNAALVRDYELVLGLSFVAAAAVVLGRFLSDAARLFLDPRWREVTG